MTLGQSGLFTVAGIAASMLFADAASAALVINVGNHALLPNTPNQKIQINVSGGDPVSGVNLYVATGDGGTALGGLPNSAPVITGLSLVSSGMVFAGHSQVPGDDAPQFWSVSSFIFGGGSIAASGLLAELTVDTSGFSSGTYALDLAFSDEVSPVTTTFFQGSEFEPGIVNGSITIAAAVPEPTAVGLALGVATTFSLFRRSRRPRLG